MERLRVKASSPKVPIDTLSGGNQQKVVLAKWLLSDRLRVLILDHPTRGLDVGAKQDVYTLVRELAARGIALVLLADTLEEIVGLSDTLLVLRDGAVTAHFTDVRTAPPDHVELLRHML
jgi:ribose transport system ATP-binding protein